MPRAAFSQIVNRSMSEVMTRSLATTSCTLLPILALLLFGGSTLQDFAFALLIGVASGAYSSIFIASPVLTHWKERETTFRHRRERIIGEFGFVPPYASASADVEPSRKRVRPTGRLTQPEAETVSSAEFEQMKRDIADEEAEASRHTSTLTKRLAHTRSGQTPPGSAKPAQPPAAKPAPNRAAKPGPKPSAPGPAEASPEPVADSGSGDGDSFQRAPDVAENDGVAKNPKPGGGAKSRSRGRRHGRRR
jgi:SecD/SecF fusion protein